MAKLIPSILILLLASVCLTLSALAQTSDTPGNGGQTNPSGTLWSYERWVGDKAVDRGELRVEEEGYHYLVVPSKAGGILKIAVSGAGFATSIEQPVFDGQMLRYSAVLWGLGRFMAAQHTAGERWVVKVGDKSYELTEPYRIARYELTGTLDVPGEAVRNFSASGSNGGWFIGGNAKSPSFLYGPPGTLLEELSPELRSRPWVEVRLPPGKGRFLGSAKTPGTRWTVVIGGMEYTAAVGEQGPRQDN